MEVIVLIQSTILIVKYLNVMAVGVDCGTGLTHFFKGFLSLTKKLASVEIYDTDSIHS